MKQASTGAFRAIPTREEVFAAAAAIPGQPPRWDGREGPIWRLTVTPGSVQIGTKDYARLNRSAEEREARRLRDNLPVLDEPSTKVVKRSEIKDWSSRSRTNMVRTFCAVDWTPFVDKVADGATPGLVTLTLPGDWLAVAPDGEAFKRLVFNLRKRFVYAWGEQIAGAWKLEFQRRGAPHLHILTVPPLGTDLRKGLAFPEWLSATWAEIVGASRELDRGHEHFEDSADRKCDCSERCRHLHAGTGVDYEETLRYGDPKRISVYFSKHGLFAEKEYQNAVPEAWRDSGKGPGRFWGVWVLEVVKANIELADNAHYVKSSIG